jgi:hypothetical protein
MGSGEAINRLALRPSAFGYAPVHMPDGGPKAPKDRRSLVERTRKMLI